MMQVCVHVYVCLLDTMVFISWSDETVWQLYIEGGERLLIIN